MTIEERLRATTQAVTESMRPVRPLRLPPAAAGAPAPVRPRRPRLPRRLHGWLVPLAAAAAVIVVAATLVTARALSGIAPQGAGRSGSATPGAAANTDQTPAYYVALTDIGTSRGGAMVRNAFLGASTGKRLVTFEPPSDAIFDYTAASSDDKTFVLDAVAGAGLGPSGSGGEGTPTSHIWYVLHVTPGGAKQARLTRIPIASSFTNDAVTGLALSPDGRTLAILFFAAGKGAHHGPLTLRTYSLATGQALRTWTGPTSSSSEPAPSNLTWLDDGHTLAFAYSTPATHPQIRTLNTTGPGTGLIADSQSVFTLPAGNACYSALLAGDGKAVICGSLATSGECAKQLELAAYSVTTGKLERVLYRYQGGCLFGTAQLAWAASASRAIGFLTISKPVVPEAPVTNIVGVITPGKFTALPVDLHGGAYGSGTIAF